MVTFHLNFNALDYEKIEHDWVIKNIRELKNNNESICVMFVISSKKMNLTLRAGDCPKGLEVIDPNRYQLKLLNAWRKLKLDNWDYSPESVVCFLKQIKQFA